MIPSLTIMQGDALEQLRRLPSESVHCCVTSPPYWGLRDYGTAEWEGGEADCDHVEKYNLRRDHSGGLSVDHGTSRGNQPSTRSSVIGFRELCGKCGAKRIDAQLGLEKTPAEYVARMVEIFREVCTVLDPFAGSGTTGAVALELGRKAILIELNPKYVELIEQRTNTTPGLVLA